MSRTRKPARSIAGRDRALFTLRELADLYHCGHGKIGGDDHEEWLRLWQLIEAKHRFHGHASYEARQEMQDRIEAALTGTEAHGVFFRHVAAHYAFTRVGVYAGFLLGVACGSKAYCEAPSDSRTLFFARETAKRRMEQVFSLPLDIKAYVYAADQMAERDVLADAGGAR